MACNTDSKQMQVVDVKQQIYLELNLEWQQLMALSIKPINHMFLLSNSDPERTDAYSIQLNYHLS